MELRKAQRSKAKAKIAFSGPSGSGKTMTALLVAYGICKDWSKVAIIDTENKSGELYANYNQKGIKIGEYNAITVKAPFTPDKYVQAIKICEDAGIEVIVIDSLTHAWAGEGGLLEMQGKIADSGKANSYTAWRFVTPKHNALVDAMLQSECHIIATTRAKTDYIQTTGNSGKTEIKKVGLAPIQRDGMEYEFTVFFDLDLAHNANASKDRTSIFDGLYFIPSVKTGEEIKNWLDSGVDVPTTSEKTEAAVLPAGANQKEPTTPPKDEGNEEGLEELPFGEDFSIEDKVTWCINESNNAATELELQTAWQKVKESEFYTSLPEINQKKVRQHFNTKKNALKKNGAAATV